MVSDMPKEFGRKRKNQELSYILSSRKSMLTNLGNQKEIFKEFVPEYSGRNHQVQGRASLEQVSGGLCETKSYKKEV